MSPTTANSSHSLPSHATMVSVKFTALAVVGLVALLLGSTAAARPGDLGESLRANSYALRLESYTSQAKLNFVPNLPGWGDLDEFNVFSGCDSVVVFGPPLQAA